MQNTNHSLTEGPIASGMVRFAIPIFLGNLFQQLYNTVDSVIVGNFLGNDALAAVSSSSSLIFLMIGFINGISMGAGVVIARHFGSGDREKLRKSIHTTLSLGILCGLVMTAIGVGFSPFILRLMHTPETVLPQSLIYFRIYFMGSIAFALYNFSVGVLQSVGDSKHPLYYLIISSIFNILLDLLLIGGFHLGVGAAAFATAMSQLLSASLCLWQLGAKAPEDYRISPGEMRIDLQMLGPIITNGLPTGLQNSVISIANVFVQSNINSFGAIAVAGAGIHSKVEAFGFLPVTAFSIAVSTYVSQNIGARNYERVRKGALIGIAAGVAVSAFIGLMNFTFCGFLAQAFTKDAEVIAYTIRQAHTMAPFFGLCAFSHCSAGLMRGFGKAVVPMCVMLGVWCFLRISYISIAIRFIHDIVVVYWAYPITWTISTIIFLCFDWRALKGLKNR